VRAQVGRQAIDGSDEIGDGVERGRLTPRRSNRALQTLADDIGLRTLPPPRFRFDLGNEGFR
jgi:hypothetical protein